MKLFMTALTEKMEETGMYRMDIAYISGISTDTLRKWSYGKSVPHRTKVKELCDAMEWDLIDLWADDIRLGQTSLERLKYGRGKGVDMDTVPDEMNIPEEAFYAFKREHQTVRSVSKGDKFGKWTAMGDYIRNHINDKLWRVKCECGNIGHVSAHGLNAFKSTQCQECGYAQQRMIEKGEVYGSWLVLGKFYRGKDHNLLYECKCLECGDKHDVRSNSLLMGQSTRCRSCSYAARRLTAA